MQGVAMIFSLFIHPVRVWECKNSGAQLFSVQWAHKNGNLRTSRRVDAVFVNSNFYHHRRWRSISKVALWLNIC